MRTKPYYSVRTGKNPLSARFDLDTLRKLFKPLFAHLEDEGYFQEALGYHCVDAGFVAGSVGQDLAGALLLELRKTDLTPIRTRIVEYAEEDLFDIIEFLYEHCSKPVQRTHHDWNGCGWHCSRFDRASGQAEYRTGVNKILEGYGDGYELSADGEILARADSGLEELLADSLPTADADNVGARVAAAQAKFRRYRSSMDERRDALRDLADVLEYLRPRVKAVLTKKDEADLFTIVNNFGIRHHNNEQQNDYDKPIFYTWLFYHYLAAIHAAVRLIERVPG